MPNNLGKMKVKAMWQLHTFEDKDYLVLSATFPTRANMKGKTMTQYLKELGEGGRVPVTDWEYMADRKDKDFVQILAAGTVIVYRIARRLGKTVEKPLVYGGRGSRDHRPWAGC
jgi:hypothetical protein